ncbi:hypothetical protein TWF481_010714 [Arthrobotrys musiformis]|uniref:RNA-dependent RNA polymerase n=1 Tax=Arthrobotrys musiformis TaxID=47236 RepID=A0AAV9W3F5_9PEZI
MAENFVDTAQPHEPLLPEPPPVNEADPDLDISQISLESITTHDDSQLPLSMEVGCSSGKSEYHLDDESDFDADLSHLTDEVESQRTGTNSQDSQDSRDSQVPSQILGEIEPPDAKGEKDPRPLSPAQHRPLPPPINQHGYNLRSKVNSDLRKSDLLLAGRTTTEKNGSQSHVTFYWDHKSAEVDFGDYEVSAQAKYEVRRTFQESKDRENVNEAVKHVLSNGTKGLTLGDAIDKMKARLFLKTGDMISSRPLDPFFSSTDFSSEFDDQTQQTGSLQVQKLEGSEYCVSVRLKPLSREVYSHRCGRQFGPRFLKLSRPRRFQDSMAKVELSTPLCAAIMKGTTLLDRNWDVIYASDASKADKDADMESSSVIMFATSGHGISKSLPVSDVIKWLIPPSLNKTMSCAKYNARVKLGFSRTVLVPIKGVQVEEVDDIVSTVGSCMTDGCGTATFAVLKAIAENIGLDYTPSYFQVRQAGRKGLIMLDVENNDQEFHKSLVIKYRREQVKFATRGDPGIEVVDYARPLKSGKLGQQLIAILGNNGVPKEVLGELAKEAIERDDIWKLLEEGKETSFIKHFYQTSGLRNNREKNGQIKRAGSMPASAEERILQMADAGFDIEQCIPMKNLVSDQNNYRLEAWLGMKFQVQKSTSVRCVPDFKGILKEGEVFLQFSSDGFAIDETFLKFLSGKILVGRAPAYMASDIQSATAVTRPEVLKVYKNVVDCIVFSSAGEYSLASRLSGGDYDGDTVLAIWDPRIVEPFVSKIPPAEMRTEETTPKKPSVREQYFEETGKLDKVRRHLKKHDMDEDAAIEDIIASELPKMLSGSKVGICTLMHQKISYFLGLEDQLSLQLADLACLLLDAAKQGLSLKKKPWEKIERDVQQLLRGRAEPVPFYMRPLINHSRYRSENKIPENIHVLDYVKGTILELKEDYEKKFKEKFPDAFGDKDLTDFFSEELDYYAKAVGDKPQSEHSLEIVQKVHEELLSFAKHRLDEIVEECRRLYPGSDFGHLKTKTENGKEKDKANKEKLFAMFQAIELSMEPGNPILDDWKRTAKDPFGKWNLLKASALFRRCSSDRRQPMLPFIVASQQLCYLKAKAKGQPFRIVQETIYSKMYTRVERREDKVKSVGSSVEEKALEPVEEGGLKGETVVLAGFLFLALLSLL